MPSLGFLDTLEGSIAFRLQRAMISRQFRRMLGYAGNFEQPKSYQEKLQFRKLYGNHAFYASVADKYRVRSYVAERVGEKYLVPLLGVYDRLDASLFKAMPREFIIKANHGCKWHRIVEDKSRLDVTATVRYFNKLQRKRYGWVAGERHYNFIQPKIVIEKLLRAEDGNIPWNYLFYCYNGPSGFQCSVGLTRPDGEEAHFDKRWNTIDGQIPGAELASRLPPRRFEEMLDVARRLSADFDFVRVDLYTVPDGVFFSEITCTPGQGFVAITNPERQRERDEVWRLDADNPLLYCKRDMRQSCAGEWPSLAIGLHPKWLRSY